MNDQKTFKLNPAQSRALDVAISGAINLMFYGGSRSGKTFFVIWCIVMRALKCKSRHVILRFRFNHAKQSIWYDTLPKVMEICFPGVKYKENKQDWFVEFDNGSQIWIGGCDDKDRVEKILGNEYSTVFFNECSQLSWDAIQTVITRLAERSQLRNVAYYDENPPSKKHWSYKVFIEYKEPIDNTELNPDHYASILMNPDDNKENISEDYFERLKSLSAAKRKRFLFGQFSDDAEGALWTTDIIAENRVADDPKDPLFKQMKRIIIGVDPAVSDEDNSDDTGIIVAGEGKDGEYYVFDDYTINSSCSAWAKEVVKAYDDYEANKVIAEVNQGGDLVKNNIMSVKGSIPYDKVRATRGKTIRAEPIVTLYEEGKVHHVGELEELETELTSWNPVTDNKSPNRLDALVWAIAYLSQKTITKAKAAPMPYF